MLEKYLKGEQVVNREIKFRGKAVDNGRWVVGSLLIGAEPGIYQIFEKRPMSDGKTILIPTTVDRATVGQYLCIKDNHGQDLFSGDLVITEQKNEDGVSDTWDRSDYGVALLSLSSESGVTITDGHGYYWSWNAPETVYHLRFIERVGNVFDNPELMNVKAPTEQDVINDVESRR